MCILDTSATTSSSAVIVASRGCVLAAHVVRSSKNAPIILSLSLVMFFFLKSFHVDAWSEFQRRNTADAGIVLLSIETVSICLCLTENLHLIVTSASELLSIRLHLDLWGWLDQSFSLILFLWWCLFNGLSRATLLCSWPNEHLWVRFLWSDCF